MFSQRSLMAIALMLACVASVNPSLAQPPQPVDKMQLLFSDDFSVDSREKYTKLFGVNWTKGKLTIPESSFIIPPVKTGERVSFTVEMQFAPLNTEGQASETRVTFTEVGVTKECVDLHFERKDGKIVGEIRLVDVAKGAFGGFLPGKETVFRQFRWPAAGDEPAVAVPSGKWRFDYDYGLLTVYYGDKEVAVGGRDIADQISSISIQQVETNAVLSDLNVSGLPLREFTVEQKATLQQSEALGLRILELRNQGKSREALPLAEKFLQQTQEVYGDKTPSTAAALWTLAHTHQLCGNLREAEPLFLRALAIERQAMGDRHPNTAMTLSQLGDLYISMGKTEEAEPVLSQAVTIRQRCLGPDHLFTRQSLNNLALYYSQLDRFDKAEPLLVELLEQQLRIEGPKHADTTTIMDSLGNCYRRMGRLKDAEKWMRTSLDARIETLPANDARIAQGYNNLGLLYHDAGKYGDAETQLRKAIELYEKAVGAARYDLALALGNLASVYEETGRFRQAVQLYERALDLRQGQRDNETADIANGLMKLGHGLLVLGDYAQAQEKLDDSLSLSRKLVEMRRASPALLGAALSNLAGLHNATGDFARAELFYREGLEVAETYFGPDALSTAAAVSNLGYFYQGVLRDYPRAKEFYSRALAIRRNILTDRHRATLGTINNLGNLAMDMGQRDEAERLLEEARTIAEEELGGEHPFISNLLSNLASVKRVRGEYSAAEKLLTRALDIDKKAYGDNHEETAKDLVNLGRVVWLQGDATRAEQLLREGHDIYRRVLDLAFAVQSQRQQLAMTRDRRRSLDAWISLTKPAGIADAQVYAQILQWKGAVFRRQRLRNLSLRDGANRQLYDQLQSISTTLASLAYQTPDFDKRATWKAELQRLTLEREQIESKLAAVSNLQLTDVIDRPDDIQALLPRDVVLVDFFQYRHDKPSAMKLGELDGSLRLLAFVVQRERPIVLVDLGDVAPLEEDIEQWRVTFGGGERGSEAAKRLRERCWSPIETHVRDAATILVSPDGVLTRLPLAALPGTKPATYLIEEQPLAILPLPQMLAQIVADRAVGPSGKQGGLLLVGNVDFDARVVAVPPIEPDAFTSISPRSRAGLVGKFKPLPGTAREIEAVRKGFSTSFPLANVMALEGAAATESAFRKALPDHAWVLAATHGFFAPGQFSATELPSSSATSSETRSMFDRSGLGAMQPDLLVGIAFAGANQPQADGADDGILTALELSGLDLSGVNLVTLSACETGLGRTAGGEGVLGLQRSFQIAGARTTVTSLWQVPDQATQLLMTRFYTNLWQKKMGKLEALREAQLWMLREAAADPGLVRGLDALDADVQPLNGRLPPYYWAAFVLSGDWR